MVQGGHAVHPPKAHRHALLQPARRFALCAPFCSVSNSIAEDRTEHRQNRSQQLADARIDSFARQTRFIDVIDEPDSEFKLENLSSYGQYPAYWDKFVTDKTPLLTGTALNVAAQVASLSAYDGVVLNDFLGGQFGKVKDYADE